MPRRSPNESSDDENGDVRGRHRHNTHRSIPGRQRNLRVGPTKGYAHTLQESLAASSVVLDAVHRTRERQRRVLGRIQSVAFTVNALPVEGCRTMVEPKSTRRTHPRKPALLATPSNCKPSDSLIPGRLENPGILRGAGMFVGSDITSISLL
jgi:hypothetical protein